METLRAGLQAPEHPCSELTGTVSGLLSSLAGLEQVCSYYRMCSLTIECVLLLSNVFSYYRMCSLTIECVLLLYLLRIQTRQECSPTAPSLSPPTIT